MMDLKNDNIIWYIWDLSGPAYPPVLKHILKFENFWLEFFFQKDYESKYMSYRNIDKHVSTFCYMRLSGFHLEKTLGCKGIGHSREMIWLWVWLWKRSRIWDILQRECLMLPATVNKAGENGECVKALGRNLEIWATKCWNKSENIKAYSLIMLMFVPSTHYPLVTLTLVKNFRTKTREGRIKRGRTEEENQGREREKFGTYELMWG